MPRKGHKYTEEQRANCRMGHVGQPAWNKGVGGCKRGHDPAWYRHGPRGTYMCYACKRENGAKYRSKNRDSIQFKNRLGRYRLTRKGFQALWELQNGACAICAASFDGRPYRIDHDHKTGEVRGILCTACNSGLGLFKDNIPALQRAIEYLTTPPTQDLIGLVEMTGSTHMTQLTLGGIISDP